MVSDKVRDKQNERYIRFKQDVDVGIGTQKYKYLKKRYETAKNLRPDLLYDISLFSLKRDLFSDSLNYLELANGVEEYTKNEMDKLKSRVWGDGRSDQHREANVFELASFLIINRQLKNIYSLDNKLNVVMGVLDERKEKGFLSGDYGLLRYSTLKIYKGTNDHRFSVSQHDLGRAVSGYPDVEVGEANLVKNIKEGEIVAKRIRGDGKVRADARTSEERYAVLDFYLRSADAYRLLVDSTTDPVNKKKYISEMKRMSSEALYQQSDNKGAQYIYEKALIAEKRQADEEGPWYKRLWSRIGFDFKYEEVEKKITSHTDYTYTAEGNVSPNSTVYSESVTKEHRFDTGFTLPITDWWRTRVGMGVGLADYNSDVTHQGYTYDGATNIFDPWSVPKTPGIDADGRNFGFLPEVRNWNINIASTFSLVKQRSPFGEFFIDTLEFTPYYKYSVEEQWHSAESDLGSYSRKANTFGANIFFNTPIFKNWKDFLSVPVSLDVSHTMDKVESFKAEYSVPNTNEPPQWINGVLCYPLYNKYTPYKNERNIFNMSGSTGIRFSGQHLILGAKYNLGITPNFLYDTNITEEKDFKYLVSNEFVGTVGWQDKFRALGRNIDYSAEMYYGFGNQTGSEWMNTRTGIDVSLFSELDNFGVTAYYHKTNYYDTHSSGSYKGSNWTTHSEGGESVFGIKFEQRFNGPDSR